MSLTWQKKTVVGLRRKLMLWAVPGILVVAIGALFFARAANRSVENRELLVRQRQVAQARSQLDSMRQRLKTGVMEYAFWDPILEVVARPDLLEAAEEVRWLRENYQLDFVVFVNSAGRVVYAADTTGHHRPGAQLGDSPLARLAVERPGEAVLWRSAGTSVYLTTAMLQGHNAEYEFRPSAEGGGFILLGQTLSDEFLRNLSAILGGTVRLEYSDELTVPAEDRDVIEILAGPDGKPEATLVLIPEPGVVGSRWSGFRAIVVYFLVAQLVGLVLLVFASDRSVIRPLLALQRGLAELREKGALSARFLPGRQDELGALAREIVHLAATLEETEKLREKGAAALLESEMRYRTLVEHAPEAIVVHDVDENRFVDANQNALDLFKLDREDLFQLGPADVSSSRQTHERAPGELVREYAQRSLSGEVPVFEWLFQDSEGKKIPCEVRLVRLPSSDSKLVRGSMIDITERKELESQLLRAQRMEAVGRLAGGIAHDFNSLLTVITGFSGVALEKLDSGDQLHGDLGLIHKAGVKAADLTRQLLAFSRQQVLQPRVLDLNTVVAEFEKLLCRMLGEDIRILTVLDPALGPLKADPGQIEQVLLNLAVNARDAMPGGGKFTIETANVELDETDSKEHFVVTPGRYIMLAVTDTGVGMDEETLGQVFEPFFTTKEMSEATGLGLASVYGIVKQSGGYIWVYSEPGKGTTFTIYLPQVEEAADRVKQEEVTAPDEGSSETILVVEDEEMVRQFAVRTLEDRGYRVLAAEHPEEALEVLKDHEGPIDLLVTDLVMPGSTGVELAEQVGQMMPEIKTLFVSGYNNEVILRLGQPPVEFLGKPFSASALARKVREILDKRSQ